MSTAQTLDGARPELIQAVLEASKQRRMYRLRFLLEPCPWEGLLLRPQRLNGLHGSRTPGREVGGQCRKSVSAPRRP